MNLLKNLILMSTIILPAISAEAPFYYYTDDSGIKYEIDQSNVKWVTQSKEKKDIFFKDYIAASQSFNSEAQFNIGCYYCGDEEIVAGNWLTAHFWFSTSAKQGFAPSQYNLAKMYLIGQGVQPDLKQAAHWFKLCGEAGDLDGQYEYAKLILNNICGLKDEAEAVRLLRDGSQKKHILSQNTLGVYLVRQGGELFEEGIKWLKQAESNGDLTAKYNLQKLTEK